MGDIGVPTISCIIGT
jgi:hypothetical protein